MRILLCVGSLDVGGTERQVMEMSKRFTSAGHDVTVLLLQDIGPVAELRNTGVVVEVVGLDRNHLLRSAWRSLTLAARLRRLGPDVVHAFLFHPSLLVLPAAVMAGIPVRIGSRRNMGTDLRGTRWRRLLQTLADLSAQSIIANAHAVAQTVPPFVRRRRCVEVIPNGVEVVAPAADVGKQPPTGVVVANLIAYKGHDVLLAALSRARCDVTVRSFGDGPERNRLEQAIERRTGRGTLELCGTVGDVRMELAAAQFLVLPSLEEGLPNAVLEAMAMGLPIVATRVGGTAEVVRDGVDGLLTTPGDPEELADALCRLVADPALRRRMGAQGRQRALELFSWERCVTAHLSFYQARRRRG